MNVRFELPREIVDEIVERITERVLDRLADSNRCEPAPSSRYLTVPEAATLLRCSRQRIDDLLSSRRLTRVKEGRRTLVARDEIEEHLRREPRRRG